MTNYAKNIKVRPSSKEAEQSVLGSILMNSELMDKAASWIPEPNAFYYQDNQYVWEAMLELREEHTLIDTVTVVEKCKTKHPDKQ